MNRRLFLAGGLLALLPRPAAARLTEIHEEFGNTPHGFALSPGSTPLIDQPARVYLYRLISSFGHSELRCYYRGGPTMLAEAVTLFAGVTGPARTVRLAAGPGQTLSEKKRAVAFDWSFQDVLRSSIAARAGRERTTELTVRLTASVPPPADPGRVKALVADLDSPRYTVRSAADRELAKLGRAAKPTLLKERAGGSAETRSRIDGLLAKLTGLALNDFELPAGVRVVSDHLPDATGVPLVPTSPAAPTARTPLQAEIERFVAARAKSSAPETGK